MTRSRPRLATLLTAIWALSACRGSGPDLPGTYRRLAVPEARLTSPEARARGRTTFLAHCAICHGVRGDGHGLRHTTIDPAPTNFLAPRWHQTVTPRYLYWRIREGVPGTAMPAWNTLGPDETWDLVAYLESIGGEAS